MAAAFADGVWFVDLAPVTDPVVVPVDCRAHAGPARSTGPFHHGSACSSSSATESMLLLLDNCEHLLDACGTLVVALLEACPDLTVLATSREPIGVPGELSWRVPSLSLDDEAIELFVDRARRVRPDLLSPGQRRRGRRNLPTPRRHAAGDRTGRGADARPVAEPDRDSLHDRFRLLTGGARTAVRRQQTLRASVDWSHALLTEPERVLFRRLAVFMGGFDLDAAQAWAPTASRALSAPRPARPARRQVTGGRRGKSAARVTGCWRRCATTRWRSSASPGRPMRCGPVIATTTPPLPLRWKPRDSAPYAAGLRAQTETDNLRAVHVWSRHPSASSGRWRSQALSAALQRSRLMTRGALSLRAWPGSTQCSATSGTAMVTTSAAVWVRAIADAPLLAVVGGFLPTRSACSARRKPWGAPARQLGDQALVVHGLATPACRRST